MAIYIPDDWVMNKNNKKTIQDILNKYFYTTLRNEKNKNDSELAKEELKRIGEVIIIEKLEDGTIKIT